MISETIQDTPDPVIQQRIEERRQRIQAEIRETERSIQTANKWPAARALPQRILRVLKKGGEGDVDNGELNPEFIKLLQNPNKRKVLLQRLLTDKAILTFNLERAARVVEGQIKANRRSHQLYWLRQFLGDPVKSEDISTREILPYYAFPYDGGEWDHIHQRHDNKFIQTYSLLMRIILVSIKSRGLFV